MVVSCWKCLLLLLLLLPVLCVLSTSEPSISSSSSSHSSSSSSSSSSLSSAPSRSTSSSSHAPSSSSMSEDLGSLQGESAAKAPVAPTSAEDVVRLSARQSVLSFQGDASLVDISSRSGESFSGESARKSSDSASGISHTEASTPSVHISSSSVKPSSSRTKAHSSSRTSSMTSSRTSSSSTSVAEESPHGESSPSERVRKVSVRDERVLKAVEANLLGALGLSTRPRPSRDHFVPPYMLELYQQQQQLQQRKARVGGSPVLGIHSPFLRVAGRGSVPANTVRSFHHSDHSVKRGCDGNACSRLLFNISSIPDTESLAAAELRLFLDLGGGPDLSLPRQGHGHVKTEERSPGRRREQHAFKVEVHEIMHTLVGGEEEEDCISRLLDTKVIDSKDAGGAWVSFDIHPAVLKWTRGPSFNKGLEVRLHPRQVTNASLESHVRVRRSVSQSEELWQRQRPLLVTYTDDGRGTLNSSPHRAKRSSARSERKRERRRKKNRKGKARRNRRNRKKKRRRKKKKKTKKGDKNLCKRHNLYVDFEDVGWKDWIQAPEGFNAYFCHGDCNFPLPHHLNSTNHAIVRTLVNSVDPMAVPKACCVPTELSAISMLYTNEWDKTILKIYKDMVVEACGCR